MKNISDHLEGIVKLLFVSNGHGEDAIGGHLAQTFLRFDPNLEIQAVPIVGHGDAYERAGVCVLGPRLDLPSGGFTFTSLKLFAEDWRFGLRSMCHQQFWAIRRAQPDVVIVVGDIYALWASLRFTRMDQRKPRLFQYQPLVSVRYAQGMSAKDRFNRMNRVTVDAFIAPERYLMRAVEHVFTRDELSAQHLRDFGLSHASFVGNPMMDLLEPERDISGALDGRAVLALLPGSRDDYLFSLPMMLTAAVQLNVLQVFAAFSGNLDRIQLPTDWMWVTPTNAECCASAQRTALHRQGTRIPIFTDAFAALLRASSVVLGTTGTANEQAVGLGKPVISFPTRGPQYLEVFARAQTRLLGAGLILTTANPNAIAQTIQRTLQNHTLLEKIRQDRVTQMGEPGGSARIVTKILEKLN